jgi:hypothetical protein
MINSKKEEGFNTLTIAAPPKSLKAGENPEVKIVSDSFHYKKFTNENGSFRIAQIKVSYKDSRPFDLTVLSGEDEFASKYSINENINCYIVETTAKNGKKYINAEW